MRAHHTLLLLAFSIIALAGCGSGGPFAIDEAQEVQIGRKTAANLEAKYGVVNDAAQTARITQIGRRLVPQQPRQNLPWTFKILNSKEVNAVSTPGGFVYVTSGLLQAVGSDDNELAGVMGHEIAHVAHRDAAHDIQKEMEAQVALGVLLGGEQQAIQIAANLGTDLALSQNYREGEFDADRDGTNYAFHAGYRANGLLRFLEFLKTKYGDQSKVVTWFGDHPQTSKRITRLREQLQAMGQPAA